MMVDPAATAAAAVVGQNGRQRALWGTLTAFIEDCQEGGPAWAMLQLETVGWIAGRGESTEESFFVLVVR
jgi:hypothetical protein